MGTSAFFSRFENYEAELSGKIEGMLDYRFDLLTDWRIHTRPRDRITAVGWWWRAARARAGNHRAVFKEPSAVFSVAWLNRRFGMRPVYLVRHPAAMVFSALARGWDFDLNEFFLPTQRWEGPFADEIRNLQSQPSLPGSALERTAWLWSLVHVFVRQERLQHPGWLLVRHEDLSADPVGRMRAIYHYLEIPFLDQSERRIRDLTGPHNPVVDPDDAMSIKRNATSLNRLWRDGLSAADQAKIHSITESVSVDYYGDADW